MKSRMGHYHKDQFPSCPFVSAEGIELWADSILGLASQDHLTWFPGALASESLGKLLYLGLGGSGLAYIY